MNTKPIPIIITLLAAGVSCAISFLQGVEFSTFLVRLLLTVLFFYLIGIVVGILMYNAFPPSPKEEPDSSGGGDAQESSDAVDGTTGLDQDTDDVQQSSDEMDSEGPFDSTDESDDPQDDWGSDVGDSTSDNLPGAEADGTSEPLQEDAALEPEASEEYTDSPGDASEGNEEQVDTPIDTDQDALT